MNDHAKALDRLRTAKANKRADPLGYRSALASLRAIEERRRLPDDAVVVAPGPVSAPVGVHSE